MKYLLLLLCLFSVGCTDAEISQFQSFGSEHSIELYSGGEKVREWTSTGKVLSEENSDGYFFCDKATQKLVRVTGDLVITPK